MGKGKGIISQVKGREPFGCRVFSDKEQKARLSPEIYESLKNTRERGLELAPQVAREVAAAMMAWAIEKGATHYTHWFQPMTNITAGKQDAFAEPGENGEIINRFSENMLIKGEPDASSFPSGGLRATFEARGYTAWDPTSPAFVKDGALYIPTAFCAYTGEALDMKTPLLRAMQAVSKEALRLIRLLGNTTSQMVIPTVGVEQEYFLVDREQYERRLDLKICGRTLVGAKPPKGQELDDHYCGRIRLRVAKFMRELDDELWNYGILSKTKHNEAAPAQHEFACLYDTANISCDHNQLAMELARTVAKKNGLACLLHEKPFDGVNGSGKHNNFSLSTDDGINLLAPGEDPANNYIFLLLLASFVRAVDKYSDLLYLAVASAGNDRRLGGYEAPPAILSIFLGNQLTGLLEHIAGSDATYTLSQLDTGVNALPTLEKDDSDRNRTSPFAFTGNKFEFRMLGASQSVALANTVLCTILSDSLASFSSRLEMADDRKRELCDIVRDTMRDHGRIIFNGNNYASEWHKEAKERRGLRELRCPREIYGTITQEKSTFLFERFHVFSAGECRARQEIMAENYSKVLQIEASTMITMASRQLYPAALRCAGAAAGAQSAIEALGFTPESGRRHIEDQSAELDAIYAALEALKAEFSAGQREMSAVEHAQFAYERLVPAMETLRAHIDRFEAISDKSAYPVPDYIDLIHRI